VFHIKNKSENSAVTFRFAVLWETEACAF